MLFHDVIYRLWCDGFTIEEISAMMFQSDLSLKRIRNIIYSKARENRMFDKNVYILFLQKFIEFQDIDRAIKYVYENQPYRPAPSVKHIRKIINMKLKESRVRKNK